MNASFFKVEFLFEGVTKNVHAASRYMTQIRAQLDGLQMRVRLCFEGNADSWGYLYIYTPTEKSIQELRRMIEATGLPPGVKIGMVYDVPKDKAITPGGRTIEAVFKQDTQSLDHLATLLWAELLMGHPRVSLLDSGEVVIRTGLLMDSKGILLWEK